MRAVALAVLLAACGGGSSSAPAEEPAIEQTAPPEAPVVTGTGAADCDALVTRTDCLYDKAGGSISPEAKKAWSDGVEAWKAALADDDTRQAVIDACRMALEAGYQGYAAMACWEVGDEHDGYVPPSTAAASGGPRDYTFQPTSSAECDAMIARTMCTFEKSEDDIPAEALKAFRDGISAYTTALQHDATRQATIDACKMSLDAGQDGFDAVGC